MGKRRRPSRKKSYEDISEIQTRMAGEKLTDDEVIEILGDEVIDEIRGNIALDNAVQDAMDYLPGRRQELVQLTPPGQIAQIAETRGNVRAAIEGEAYLNKLGQLQGNVPMPVMRDGGDTRLHTQYRVDPTTGQQLVAPFMNPDMPSEVLVTRFGKQGIDDRVDHQAEPISANALRLLGNRTRYHDTGADGTYGKADLAQVTKSGKTEYLDVMVDDLRNSQVPIPMYTSLFNTSGPRNARTTEGILRGEMQRQGTNDVRRVVEGLVQQGTLGPSTTSRAGKLMRGDENVFSGDRLYHGLVMPGYSGDVMARPMPSSPKRIPTAPDRISLVDLEDTLNALGNKPREYKMNRNRGHGGQGYERLQVKPYFDRTPEEGVYDATMVEPLVQQLLSNAALRQRQV